MKQATFLAIFLALLILGQPSARAREQAAFAPGQFRAYVEDDRTALHHATEVLPLFDAMMIQAKDGQRGVGGLSNQDLVSLADDAGVANFYFPGSRVKDHKIVFDELARRNIASDLMVDDYFRTLVAARKWEAATALSKRFPSVTLERLPLHIAQGDASDGASLHYLDYDSSKDLLTRKRLDVAGGLSLIVVSHPNCGFSRAALAEIETNRSLRENLPPRTFFVAPTFGGLQLDRVRLWNASHPNTRHVLVDSPISWRFVRQWNTPQFLFLVEGQVVASLEGWPDDSHATLLIAAAQKAAHVAVIQQSRNGPSTTK